MTEWNWLNLKPAEFRLVPPQSSFKDAPSTVSILVGHSTGTLDMWGGAAGARVLGDGWSMIYPVFLGWTDAERRSCIFNISIRLEKFLDIEEYDALVRDFNQVAYIKEKLGVYPPYDEMRKNPPFPVYRFELDEEIWIRIKGPDKFPQKIDLREYRN